MPNIRLKLVTLLPQMKATLSLPEDKTRLQVCVEGEGGNNRKKQKGVEKKEEEEPVVYERREKHGKRKKIGKKIKRKERNIESGKK